LVYGGHGGFLRVELTAIDYNHHDSIDCLARQVHAGNSLDMKKDSQLTVRLSSELLAKLKALAKSEDRSLAYVVERILREHFEAPPGKRKP
jgi:hypothetical protein